MVTGAISTPSTNMPNNAPPFYLPSPPPPSQGSQGSKGSRFSDPKLDKGDTLFGIRSWWFTLIIGVLKKILRPPPEGGAQMG